MDRRSDGKILSLRCRLGAFIGLILLVLSFSAGCRPDFLSGRSAVEEQIPSLTVDEQADRLVASMTMPEKVGQMVMIGIHGRQLDEDSRYMLRQFHIGGILLFDRNIESGDQLKALTAQLQEYAQGKEAGQKLPLFIGLDEEGGRVSRGRAVIPAPRSAQEIGMSGDPAQAEESAGATAAILQQYGIQVNFAPVADINGGDSRDYSGDAQTAVAFVSRAADGYEKAGMIYALKHFPGIGRSRVDSHREVSRVEVTEAGLEQEELVPFRAVIEYKSPENYFVLVSHLIYPALDAENPASQSEAVMTGLLRRKLGFSGVVITDDLEMGAVANHAPYRELGKRAVQAGADMVLICHEYAHETEVYLGLLDAVKSGEISEERVNESVRRIVRMKLPHAL